MALIHHTRPPVPFNVLRQPDRVAQFVANVLIDLVLRRSMRHEIVQSYHAVPGVRRWWHAWLVFVGQWLAHPEVGIGKMGGVPIIPYYCTGK